MNNADADILQNTMAGLEAGLLVRHIAVSQPVCCGPHDDVVDVLSAPRVQEFDYIPVKDGERFIGVLKRENGITGLVAQHMQPLDDSMLVSVDVPLTQFIPLTVSSPFRLVVGSGIEGIVTRSDMLKLPVRLLTFTLLTHLEMVMAEVIRARCPNDHEWLELLSAGRRGKVLEKEQLLKRDRLDLSLLECTDFCDKRDIIAKLCHPSGSFVADLKRIGALRDTLAHASNYAENEDQRLAFVHTLARIHHWIDELAGYLPSTGVHV